MGNKKIQYILLVLFIISFALGALGFLNRNKKHSSANDANIKSLVYSNKTAEIASLNEKIGGYEFTKGIKRFHYAYINSDINDDNTITYTILSSSFEAEENPHDVSYNFNGINTPVAVHAMVNLSIEGVLVKSYVLDSNSRLYLVTFLAEESKHNGFEITEYKVDNIERLPYVINQAKIALENRDFSLWKIASVFQ